MNSGASKGGFGLGLVVLLMVGGARVYRYAYHGADARASQPQTGASDDADRLFNDGYKRYEDGEYDAAIRSFTEHLREYPDDVDAYLNRGLARQELRQYRKAVNDLNEVLARTPDDGEAFLIRGTIWEDLGEHSKAIADYRKTIELAPEEPWPHNNLAWVLVTSPHDACRDGEDASKHLKRFFELGGEKDWISLDTVAAAFAEKGKFKRAVEIQNQVLEFAPEDAEDELRERLELYLEGKPYRSGGGPQQ